MYLYKIRALLTALLYTTFRLAAHEFFVSPNGDDAHPGTQALPFASLEQARDAVRDLRSQVSVSEPVTVWLEGGDYILENRLQFTTLDSNVRYRALPGEIPRVLGGPSISASDFQLVTSQSPVWNRLLTSARGNVVAADLAALGISDYGTLRSRGFSGVSNSPMELYVNGRPMTLARWPNRGSFANTSSPVSALQFTYTGTRPERWTEADELWVHGYFQHLWADFARPAVLDTANKTITLTEEMTYGMQTGRPWFAFNLLEELDIPGEYYIDRSTGMLYYWPSAPLEESDFVLSKLENELIRIQGAADMLFEGVTFLAGRQSLLRITEGENNRFVHCRFLGSGHAGVIIDGTGNGLERCEVAYTGGAAVILDGGDRATLTPGGNYVKHSRIHHFGRLTLTYQGGVHFRGVGQVARHNRIHDGDHTGVRIIGNDHELAYNHIHDVLKWTYDMGMIYTGRDWSFRGNVIRRNFLHDGLSGFSSFVFGVYLDDAASGYEVDSNVFYKVGGAAMFNAGGHENRWINNYVVDSGAFHRGEFRNSQLSSNQNTGNSWDMLHKLNQFPWKEETWLNAYPELAPVPNTYSGARSWYDPIYNRVNQNISWLNNVQYQGSVYGFYESRANNLNDFGDSPLNPKFRDIQTLDFTLEANSPAHGLPGFEEIPFYEIGLPPLWTGARSQNWQDPQNWSPSFVPDQLDTALFDRSVSDTPEVEVQAEIRVRRIMISGADPLEISGLSPDRRLFLGGGGFRVTEGTHMILGEKSVAPAAGDLLLQNNTDFEIAEGAELRINARLHHGNNQNRTHRKTGEGVLSILSNNGDLPGTWKLSDDLGFEVWNGTLRIEHPYALGALSNRVRVFAGGSLELADNFPSSSGHFYLNGTGHNLQGALRTDGGGDRVVASHPVGQVVIESGSAIRVDSHSLVIGRALSGEGDLSKTGEGTLILAAGENSHSGETAVEGGALFVNGTLNSGAVRVSAGAALGGSGSFAGGVRIKDSGELYANPEAGYPVFANDLHLESEAVFRFTPDPANEGVAVAGTLTLDGTLNVVSGDSLETGVYTLFSYEGDLEDQGLEVGEVTDGSRVYRIDTSVQGIVRLTVRTPFDQWVLDIFEDPEAPEADPEYVDPEKRMTTYQQFLAGLDPLDPESRFELQTAKQTTEGEFRIRWSTIGGRRYRVMYSDHLGGTDPDPFVDVVRDVESETAPGPEGEAGMMEFIDDFSLTPEPANPYRFYRIRLVLP